MSLLRFPLLSALIALFLGGLDSAPNSSPDRESTPKYSSADAPAAPDPVASEPAPAEAPASTPAECSSAVSAECSPADSANS